MFRWLKRWFSNNLWLKLIALFLAIISWLYINEEVKEGSTIQTPEFLSRFIRENPIISKRVSIQPNIKGEPPRGYKIQPQGIRVRPKVCKIWGRKAVLSNINSVYTYPIDVRKRTQDFTTQVQLERIKEVILPQKTIVEVKIPIVSKD